MSTGDLSKLRVVELKEELQKRGGSTSGVKADLILRLEELIGDENVSADKVDRKPEPKTVASSKTLTPKTPTKEHSFEYEFGGPIGALGVMIGLPGVIYMLFFVCG